MSVMSIGTLNEELLKERQCDMSKDKHTSVRKTQQLVQKRLAVTHRPHIFCLQVSNSGNVCDLNSMNISHTPKGLFLCEMV